MTMTKMLALLLGIAIASVASQESAIVRTKYGDIEGSHSGLSRDGSRFYEFLGIQYAVIEERFSASVEPTPWNGTIPANTFGPSCMDVESHGDENCLFLNVYTRDLPRGDDGLRPVFVFIHGGSFQVGAGSQYGANYLMDEVAGGMIFITINYRLGLLGFLSTEDEASPGNYGLKDQVMALKWIRDNIAQFGGDPSKVTIAGQSAGGASVTYHVVSPMSQGLFKHGIPISGTFLDPWAFIRRPLRYAKRAAEHFNCPDSSTSEGIIRCLRDIPTLAIANISLASNLTVKFFHDPIAAFGPTIEPLIGDGSGTFLSRSPYEILTSGNFSKVPLLAGVCKEEGVYFWAAMLLMTSDPMPIAERHRLQANWTGVAPSAFYFDEKAPPSRLQEVAEKVESFYFDSRFALDDNSTFPQLSHLYSDRMFVASMVRFMNLYSKHAPIYPYLYTFNKFVGIVFGWEELHNKYSLDATHSAEMDMFTSPLFDQVRVDPDHDEASRNMIRLWTSFINEGVPSATYGSERSFPPINGSEGLQHWYQLDMDTALVDNFFAGRVAFWEGLGLADDDFLNCYC